MILISLVELASAEPVTASAVGFILSASVNYVLNYYLTFNSNAAHGVAGPKFLIIALIGLILNSTILFVMVNAMLVHYVVGQIIATGLVLIWSFVANKYWSFKS